MIEYQKILDKNMLNVFIDILKNIRDNGLTNNNHLYITFYTNHEKVELPKWLKKQYPEEMTIVIQYKYNNLIINNEYFSITLSFNNIKTNLKIGFEAIKSFADPSANFGLILQKQTLDEKERNNRINKDNVIDFSSFKKDYDN